MQLSELENKPKYFLNTKFRSHWPFQVVCWWYWWVFAKGFWVLCDSSSAGEFSGYFLTSVSLDVSGYSSKLSCWTILDIPLENSMVCISPNLSGGVMLKIFFDAISINCTLHKKKSNIWLRMVAWSVILMGFYWCGWRT